MCADLEDDDVAHCQALGEVLDYDEVAGCDGGQHGGAADDEKGRFGAKGGAEDLVGERRHHRPKDEDAAHAGGPRSLTPREK